MNDYFSTPFSQDYVMDNLALNVFSIGFAITSDCGKNMSNEAFYAFFSGKEDGKNILK